MNIANYSNVSAAEIKIYPNPINEKATIEFYLTQQEDVSAVLYNINGSLVWSAIEKTYPFGFNKINFERENNMKPGVYFFKIRIGSNSYYTKCIFQ